MLAPTWSTCHISLLTNNFKWTQAMLSDPSWNNLAFLCPSVKGVQFPITIDCGLSESIIAIGSPNQLTFNYNRSSAQHYKTIKRTFFCFSFLFIYLFFSFFVFLYIMHLSVQRNWLCKYQHEKRKNNCQNTHTCVSLINGNKRVSELCSDKTLLIQKPQQYSTLWDKIFT